MNPEENLYIEDPGRQEEEGDGEVTHKATGREEAKRSDDGLQLAVVNLLTSESEKGFASDEGLVEPGPGEEQEPPLMCRRSEEDRDVKTDSDVTVSEAARVELQTVHNKQGLVSLDQEETVGPDEQTMAERSGRNKKEEEDGSVVVEREIDITTEEENVDSVEVVKNNRLDEGTEQEEGLEVMSEDSEEEEEDEEEEEEDLITEYIGVSKWFTTDVEIESHINKDGDQDDESDVLEKVTRTSEEEPVRNKSAEIPETSEYCHHESTTSAVTGIHVPVDESFVYTGKNDVQEERISSEEERTVSNVDAAFTTSAPGKTEMNNGEEITQELKDVSLRTCEGFAAEPQELHSIACEETQEGVPEYNNGQEPDEERTQTVLEVTDYDEIQTTQLPEEVESKEPESFQNVAGGVEAGQLLLSEGEEEDREREEEEEDQIENNFDMVVEERAAVVRLTDAELPTEAETPLNDTTGHLFTLAAGPVDPSMKTAARQSDKVSETDVGSTEQTYGKEKELYDQTEESSVELGSDSELSESREAELNIHNEKSTVTEEGLVGLSEETVKFSETGLQEMTESGFSDEPMDTTVSEPSSSWTTSLPEDAVESGVMEQFVESWSKILVDELAELQDTATEMPDARSDTGETTGTGTEEKAVKYESGSENDTEVLNLSAVETLSKKTDGKESSLTEGSEPSIDTDTELPMKTQHEPSDKTVETGDEETIIDTEPTDIESQSGDTVTISMETEITRHGITEDVTELSGHRDEEPTRPVIGHESKIDEEILDMWIETVLSEDTDHTESKLLPETRQTSEDQDRLMKDTTEAGLSHLEEDQPTDTISGQTISKSELLENPPEIRALLPEVGHDKFHNESQEGIKPEEAESVESEIVLETEIDAEISDSGFIKLPDRKEAEDLEIKSPTMIDALHQAKPVVNTMSNIPDEIKQTDAGLSNETEETKSVLPRERSEVWSEEGTLKREGGLYEEICFESKDQLDKVSLLDKAQLGGSEVIPGPLAGLNTEKAEPQVTLPPRTSSGDQFKFDVTLLDFTAQKSRITVKNPSVRPPKDPRALLQMPSVDPTPLKPTGPLPVGGLAGKPLGGLGIGIKLPGLGVGFPVLKKTRKVMDEENNTEVSVQKSETEPEVKDGSPRHEEAERKPRWTPPRQPGFGNPLMSELKNKLKKTTKE
ncbi:uncharacterized protein ACJ7VT_004606 [Polymixia lowei]